MGKLIAICTSPAKGTQKTQVPEAVLREDWGIEGDAHAGHWHRQVSLLGLEQIEAFRKKGAQVEYGAFGENLVVEGVQDLKTIQVGSRIKVGACEMELTQIGKACHSHCAIYKVMDDCIMPREGVFARVVRGGVIRPGDAVEVEPLSPDHPFTAAVITLSDRAYAGKYEDKSGPEIRRILEEHGYEVEEQILLPDGKPMLEANLCRLADQRQINVIFTTGGTGFAERDQTPEATVEVCDRMADGISQAILVKSLSITDKAMLSRGRSGIRKKTLIINLPGSPKACREDLDIVLPALGHGLGILRGTATD
ncbi:MAG: molybdenum cofactor synthesis domain-containing protein [Lachnospiraceae bacterium]|jgi:molybdopterin adenylyltransferase